MVIAKNLTLEELQDDLENIKQSPKSDGTVHMIVRRPDSGEREVIDEGQLDLAEGLVGDNWGTRGSSRSADGSAHPDMQLTLMNSRVIDLIAQDEERWQLAGDQFFVDLDLSEGNLPPGTRIAFGTAVIEATDQPHTACKKFVARFGVDALKFLNTAEGKALQLRGINCKVVEPGVIRAGDVARKL